MDAVLESCDLVMASNIHGWNVVSGSVQDGEIAICSKELNMFEVSDEGSKKIGQFLEGSEGRQTIRVLLTEGGWRGPYLVMALDEQKEADEVFTEKGVTIVIERELFERVKPIRIGYTHSSLGSGYTLESQLMKDMKGVSAGCHEICDSCNTVKR
jgi:Fe-S cluster assembly iron-binding protein IscA